MRILLLIFSVFFLCAGTVVPRDSEEQPKFVSEGGEKLFAAAQKAFRDKNWKEAKNLFRESTRDAADNASKELLRSWLKATRGGDKLEKLEAALAKAQWRASWNEFYVDDVRIERP